LVPHLAGTQKLDKSHDLEGLNKMIVDILDVSEEACDLVSA
jgi:hypothetical protein